MDPRDIGEEIRARRRRLGLTLAELARRAGTSAPTLHRYENGWRRFEVRTLERLAAALGCRLDLNLRDAPDPGPRDEATTLVRQLGRLFWDHRLTGGDLDRYPGWVVGRVLEYGSLEDVRALVRRYGRERFLDLVSSCRFESSRTRTFWTEMLRSEGRECTTRFSRREADASWTL